jgi:hypothetical protein
VAYPASYGDAPQRLSPAAWDAYSGVLGHQHAPDNSHGDPGAIDINRILSAARGDDDVALTADEKKALGRIDEIDTRTAAIWKLLTDEGNIGRRSKESTIILRALKDQTGIEVDEAELAGHLLPPLIEAMGSAAFAAAIPKAVRAELAAALAEG